eukprot:gene38593-50688_t
MPFKRGQSGNPAGKVPGTRNRATLAVEALLEGEAEALSRKAIEMALAGDTVALRLCLERIAPVRKGRAIAVDLGPVKTAQDFADAQGAIIAAMGSGEITTDEATDAAKVVELVAAALERRDIEASIAALEAKGRRIEGLEARSVPLVGVIPKAVRDAAVSAALQRLRDEAPGHAHGFPAPSNALQAEDLATRVIAAALRADQ